MLKAIAIDDEPIALEVVKSLSGKVPFIELKACFTNAFEALTYLQREKIDLVFLDIKMPDITGIEWLKSVPQPPMVIFTTAYSEHAVESFELDAVDYLLKPFSLARFLKAANKANELARLKNRAEAEDTKDESVFIKSGYEQVRILLNELLYVQSAGNYLHFICTGQKLLARLTMNEAESLLPASKFTRVHRSYIIANKRVTRIDKNSVWIEQTTIPIGAGYSAALERITKDKYKV
ncbi:MAG: response regulator transcription factor [Terrimonas sp.]|uniref:LytR/AlgR family response regulator transcription factor n=1 Tax=Terrimonas sp. TaxID=1914338 RepID=UPI00092A1D01|nr:LytTR family DNA-binding domain-containing protein [Terrimonas sp.]MBN8787074.1 response regulator transcription factor [Terrimonas sp.]OJY95640.1 MAG: DNA-binding response regulator [Sphingobacteriales bacterium 40-81]PVD52181.1 DNA-binding response regulator [Terrimonas sp.]